MAQEAVSPSVALQMGVEILCQLFQVWDQVPIGLMTLTEWLLGDYQAELGNEKTLDLVRTQSHEFVVHFCMQLCLGEHSDNVLC